MRLGLAGFDAGTDTTGIRESAPVFVIPLCGSDLGNPHHEWM